MCFLVSLRASLTRSPDAMFAVKAIAAGIVIRCLLFVYMGEGGLLRLAEISSEYTSFLHGLPFRIKFRF